MLISLSIFIYILGIYNSFHKKNNKIISFLLFFLVLILMGGVTNNPDYLNYQYIYDYNIPGLELGFSMLMDSARSLGFSYNVFRLIVIFVSLLFVNKFLNNLNVKKDLYWIIYIPYLMILDSIQIRNFLMISLVLFGLKYLIENNSFKNNVIFLVIVIISSSIQKLGLFYLLFPFFLFFLRKSKHIFVYIFIIFFLSILLVTPDIYIPLLDFITNNFLIGTDQSFYLIRKVDLGFLVFWFLSFIILVVTFIYSNKVHRIINPRDKSVIRILSSFVFFSSLFIPLYIIDLTYWRLMRNAIPAFVIINLLILKKENRYFFNRQERLFLYSLNGIFIIIILFFEVLPILQSSFLPMFLENWMF
ncbi:EpsG family protein [Enterococcus casseliflavus]|uniref:EpsG family protein n=1 Tax=Enterococcus casseliflavus TaxID=37734 RepID=UPI00119D0EFB|nr:EpsG family protein [Enterococcus casseliflavus]MBZ3640183.1 EpsG family protein [Enterococcus casseliflavus]